MGMGYGPCAGIEIALDFVLPDSVHSPTLIFERASDTHVPKTIALNLGAPIVAVRRRRTVAVGASMPKASINEHGQPDASEGDIWLARDASRVQPVAAQSKVPKTLAHCQLWLRVAGPYRRHVSASVFGCEPIHDALQRLFG